ncbi:hypothetical protein [Pedobacter agri]|uniref:hypothetical protein n=1 Tax=Pedobacter agri TaxID=454586 RepID=UPI00277EC89B|nr:hypothetical protein [Pedobacter agri]MDQ1139103.1 hypothetical protein [Pedobacter agri]
MKRSIQIILVMCLCFVIKAQAQITIIDTYSNKIKRLSLKEREELDKLLFGPISRMQLNETGKPTFLWAEEGSVKGVELTNDLTNQLKDTNFSTQLKYVEVISIKWEKDKNLILNEDHLNQLKSLKYILIKSYDSVNIDQLKELFKDLISTKGISTKIEIVYFEMELPS